MPLDLTKITPAGGDAHIEPRDIFASLPKRPWPRLRLEQGEVLKEWFDRRDERDLVIKQNTGGGKTVVGLLAAKSSLNEGIGPAVYLVPDTYLVDQVVGEAGLLGIPVTTDAKSTKFRASQEILVATFHKIINGRSVFGVSGASRDVVTLGTVVVDDAHAALAAARSQFTASLPATHQAYAAILKLFESDLRQQSAKNYADLADGQACAPMRIPFWAWEERQDQVLQILNEYGEDDGLPSLFFAWPLIADHLPLAVATITHTGIEVKTPCPPINMIPAFDRARRRVYLTATLADDGVLVTELGADPSGVRHPITPERAADLGDRMILAPLELNPSLIGDTVRQMVRDLADGDWDGDNTVESEAINVVVLVPSDHAAEAWEDYADEILHVDDMKPVIEQLTSGDHLGIVVLVNKYDGVDLPSGACRLLVIDEIPTPLNASERREAAALAGSKTYQARKIQRIEQGMGRGVRDAEDHCAVLLLGSELGLALADPGARALFSPATRAQIDLSRQVAQQITGQGLHAVREALQLFLSRDEDWRLISSAAIAGVEYDRDGHVSPIAIARRQAFDKAAANDPVGALETMRKAIAEISDPIERGWYLEEAASYQQLVSPAGAQRAITEARTLNHTTLRPKVAIPVQPIRGTAAQAKTASDTLSDQYTDGGTLRLGIAATLNQITWDESRTSEAEEAMRQLGLQLGFISTRPELEVGKGPDNLWALSESHHAIIELKTGVTRPNPEITKDEAGQLADSVNWDIENNQHVTQRTPVLVHPSAQRHQTAHPPPGTRIITADHLEQLKQAVRDFAAQIADASGWKDPRVVAQALTAHQLIGDKVITAHSSKPLKSPRSR